MVGKVLVPRVGCESYDARLWIIDCGGKEKEGMDEKMKKIGTRSRGGIEGAQIN